MTEILHGRVLLAWRDAAGLRDIDLHERAASRGAGADKPR